MTSQLPLLLVLTYAKSSAAELPLFGVTFLLILKPFLFNYNDQDNYTRMTRITGKRSTLSCRRKVIVNIHQKGGSSAVTYFDAT